jgi:hypothetical protein
MLSATQGKRGAPESWPWLGPYSVFLPEDAAMLLTEWLAGRPLSDSFPMIGCTDRADGMQMLMSARRGAAADRLMWAAPSRGDHEYTR